MRGLQTAVLVALAAQVQVVGVAAQRGEHEGLGGLQKLFVTGIVLRNHRQVAAAELALDLVVPV